jgi:hypothetical protein
MCDYSLHHVKSRPAKVGDKLTKSVRLFHHRVCCTGRCHPPFWPYAGSDMAHSQRKIAHGRLSLGALQGWRSANSARRTACS